MDLSSTEREFALQLLSDAEAGLTQAVRGLPDAEWRTSPSDGAWSVAQIAGHIVAVERIFHVRVVPGLAVGPPPEHYAQTLDADVIRIVPDRTTKYTALRPLVPAGSGTIPEALEQFAQIRGQTLAYISGPNDFRGHTVPHPVLGPLDGYQWVLMVACHCARHTAQIEEVKRALATASEITGGPNTAAAAG